MHGQNHIKSLIFLFTAVKSLKYRNDSTCAFGETSVITDWTELAITSHTSRLLNTFLLQISLLWLTHHVTFYWKLVINIMDRYNENYHFFGHGKLQWRSLDLWKGSDWVTTCETEDGKYLLTEMPCLKNSGWWSMFKIMFFIVLLSFSIIVLTALAPTAAVWHSFSFPSLHFPFHYDFHPIQLSSSIQFFSVKLIIHFDHLRLSIFFTHLIIFWERILLQTMTAIQVATTSPAYSTEERNFPK